MNYAFINGKILDGTKDMEIQEELQKTANHFVGLPLFHLIHDYLLLLFLSTTANASKTTANPIPIIGIAIFAVSPV